MKEYDTMRSLLENKLNEFDIAETEKVKAQEAILSRFMNLLGCSEKDISIVLEKGVPKNTRQGQWVFQYAMEVHLNFKSSKHGEHSIVLPDISVQISGSKIYFGDLDRDNGAYLDDKSNKFGFFFTHHVLLPFNQKVNGMVSKDQFACTD